jgi:hypothetical protein
MHKETHHNNRKLAFLKATIALSRNKTTFTLGFPKSGVFIEVEFSFPKKKHEKSAILLHYGGCNLV